MRVTVGNVGLWPRSAAAAVSAVQTQARPRANAGDVMPWASSTVYELTTGQPVSVSGAYSSPVSRDLAMSVPAVQRGVTLKVTTFAGLPIERIAPSGQRTDLGWLEQPEANRPRFATLCDIGYDLELDGVAYLRVHQREVTGEPKRGGVEYIALPRVGNAGDTISVDGKPVNPADLIGFEGWHDGIRRHGARTIRTAIALEAAAQRYADSPLPAERLVNTSDFELDDSEIDALLATYKQARNSEAVAYLNAGIKPETVGFDAAQLQLIEGRQFLATQIANLVGIPAHYIAGAAASAGGTVTYANVTQDARALIDYGLKPMIRAVESRLSMSDVTGRAWDNQVTPRGTVIRFNIDGLLRGNPLERAQLYAQLIPLGVLTVDEARAMEDLTPTGGAQA